METAVLAVLKAAPRAGREQPEDLLAFACARRLDRGLLAVPRPGGRARAPRRAAGGIAPAQDGRLGGGTAQPLRPGRGAPPVPCACIQRRRDAGRFLRADAQVLQPLGDGADVGNDAEAVVNPLLDQGRAPAGTATTGVDRPRVKAGGAGGCLRRGARRRTARRLLTRRARAPRAAAHASPGGDGLFVPTSDHRHLGTALAVYTRQDRQEICALAPGAQVLGRLQWAFHFFTRSGRHGKTHAAQRDVPPPRRCVARWQECLRCVAARQSTFRKSFS